MEPTSTGELVTVSSAGPDLDGIVFDIPSNSKVVVAVMDPTRGPRFLTVSPNVLKERAEEGPNDRALRALVRRTPPPARGGGQGGVAGGRGRSGFQRGPVHRTTGR
jgi:hypothetical protein